MKERTNKQLIMSYLKSRKTPANMSTIVASVQKKAEDRKTSSVERELRRLCTAQQVRNTVGVRGKPGMYALVS